MKRTSLALAVMLSSLACAIGTAASDSARVVKYSQTDIVPIRAKVRFTTLIVLPANEEILDFTVGDKDFWIVNGIHNLCYLHPALTGIRSNMNLVTASGRVYSFLLSEITNQPDVDPDLKVFVEPKEESTIGSISGHVEFVRASEVEAYKQEAVEARMQAAKEVQQAEARVQQQIEQYRKEYPGKLRFDYTYKPKASQVPFLIAVIYHDDRFTYIKCSAQEKPTVYELKDGKPNLVNFDFENGVYVIPKIVDHGYLAVGKQKVNFDREPKS
jgi:type IV secretion system protein VirB9